MNKKQLIIAAMTAALSVSTVSASTITGINPDGNIFNISPDQINGTVGYRKYTDFSLDAGDIANLIYYGKKNGQDRNLEAFVNLVQNHVNINGILNTVNKNGSFANGHAIFITPSGLTVGSSGVLNVGALSVATPSASTYRGLVDDYAVGNFTNINQVSKLKQDSNAPIKIDGIVVARRGIDLRGTNIDINGKLLNGIENSQVFSTKAQAETLFRNLVNTDGSFKTSANAIQNGSIILIKADDNASNAGINIYGNVVNNDNGGTFLTNKGNAGLTVGGTISDRTDLTLNNQAGELFDDANLYAGNKLAISNSGTNLDITGGGYTTGINKLDIVNNGTGNTNIAGILNSNDIDIVNNQNAGKLNVYGNIGNGNSASTRIMNRGEKALIDANVVSRDILISNKSSDGLTVSGTVNGKTVNINNSNGNLTISGDVRNYGNSSDTITIYNTGDKLALASSGQINASGKLAIKNTGIDGMTLDGTIVNTGSETAINNTDGALLINGSITNSGNMGIKNTGSGTGTGADLTITKNAVITNNGSLNIRNSGDNGMTIVGTIKNEGNSTTHTDNLYIINEAGKLQFAKDTSGNNAASVTNTNGDLYIAGTRNSEGIYAASETTISNAQGSLAIRNKGELTAEGTRGLDLQGNITNNGTALAINNDYGNMYVSGNITAEAGNLGIINRAGAGSMTLASNGNITTAEGQQANIKNYGSGDMIVNSTITNNGRTNVIANSGELQLGGTLNNKSGALSDNGGFYATSRANGTGINVTSGFNADNSTSEILIKNISGENGLRYNGNIVNNGYQTALVNKNGSLNVSGDITGNGAPVIISNSGNGLDVTSSSDLSSDTEVKIVNTGSVKANLSGKISAPNARVLYEQIKK